VSRNANLTEIPATATPQRLAYPIKDAAQLAGVTAWTIHTAISEGRLTAHKLGKRWLVLHSDLVHFLNELDPAEPSTKWLEKRKKAAAA
jgi:excisionase family DNA binding protein